MNPPSVLRQGAKAPWRRTFHFCRYSNRYKLELRLPFSRQRDSLEINPVLHKSFKARLTVERDSSSSLAMVLIPGQHLRDCIGHHRVILKAVQLRPVLRYPLPPVVSNYQIYAGDPVLGDAQPLVRAVEVGVQVDGLLQREIMVRPPVRVIDILDYIPAVGVGFVGVGSVMESFAPFFRQAQFLRLPIKAAEICRIVTLYWIASQAVEVVVRLNYKAVVLTADTALNLAAVGRESSSLSYCSSPLGRSGGVHPPPCPAFPVPL